jgi:shikimate dehydrogenase
MEAVKILKIRGVSVTSPLKQLIMQYLDDIDEAATEIGAVNTVVNTNGKLKGYNTDWIGIQKPLVTKTDLRNKKVLIIGAGGAARAAAYALKAKPSTVTIASRTYENARKVAETFGMRSESLTILSNLKEYDIILLAVPSGKNKEIELQLEKNMISDQLLFNFSYASGEAQFLKRLLSNGIHTIDGYEMLFYQGLEQFSLFTEMSAPTQELHQAMRTYLKKELDD